MKFNMACSTWIKEDHEKVLKALKASEKRLSAKELSAITGLSVRRVNRTLYCWRMQERLYHTRKNLLKKFLNE